MCEESFPAVQRKTTYFQGLKRNPASMTKRRQKFHGTKMAPNGTKSLGDFDVCSRREAVRSQGE
jgi:hypothetical protein